MPQRPHRRGAKKVQKSQQEVGLAAGFRSGLEEQLADQLQRAGVAVSYEAVTLTYAVEETRKYTPDFVLPNGIVIESKGRFVTSDRKKHLLVKKQYPGLDIRFVFSNSRSRISKTSKTTYGAWAVHKGFAYADRLIPVDWLLEPANPASLEILQRIMEPTA